jgi:stage IV sporulation protein FB
VIEFREPPRTGFELAWRMFGIHVRVMPSFFLIAGLLAYLFVGPNLLAILVDVACIFVAILFTEIVQGLVYRSYGLRSTVLVQDFGGGVYPEAEPPTTLQRIVAAMSSPASSFLLFVAVYFSNEAWGWSNASPYAGFAYFILCVVSLFWAILGLLPIFPYPGGRVMGEVLSYLSPRHGPPLTMVISIAVAMAYVAYTAAVLLGHMGRLPLPGGVALPASIFAAVFFAIAAMRSWQYLQAIREHQRAYRTDRDEYDDRAPWER